MSHRHQSENFKMSQTCKLGRVGLLWHKQFNSQNNGHFFVRQWPHLPQCSYGPLTTCGDVDIFSNSYFVHIGGRGGGPRVVVNTATFYARARGSVPGLGGLKETKMFLPHPRVKVSIVGSLRDREVACSASDRHGSNFVFCVWRTVSFQSSHHPQEALLAQFSLYVRKGGLKPDSFHFLLCTHMFIGPYLRYNIYFIIHCPI